MPVATHEIAERRAQERVDKLIRIIDENLLNDKNAFPYTFDFHTDVSPNVIEQVMNIYRNQGWTVRYKEYMHGAAIQLQRRTITFEDPAGASSDAMTEEVIQKALATPEGIKNLGNFIVSCTRGLEAVGTSIFVRRDMSEREIEIFLNDGEHPMSGGDRCDWSDIFRAPKTTSQAAAVAELGNMIKKYSDQRINAFIHNSMLASYGIYDRTIQTYSETFDRAIMDSLSNISEYDYRPHAIVMNSRAMYKLININIDHFRNNLFDGTADEPYCAKLPVKILPSCPDNDIFVVGSPHELGDIFLSPIQVTEVYAVGDNLVCEAQQFMRGHVKSPGLIQRVTVRF